MTLGLRLFYAAIAATNAAVVLDAFVRSGWEPVNAVNFGFVVFFGLMTLIPHDG